MEPQTPQQTSPRQAPASPIAPTSSSGAAPVAPVPVLNAMGQSIKQFVAAKPAKAQRPAPASPQQVSDPRAPTHVTFSPGTAFKAGFFGAFGVVSAIAIAAAGLGLLVFAVAAIIAAFGLGL